MPIAGRKTLTGLVVPGVLTIGIAVIFAIILPSNPRTTRLLNEVERDLVLYHFELDDCTTDATDERVGNWEAFMMTIKDAKTWMFTGILSICYIAGAVVQFFPRCVHMQLVFIAYV